MSLAVIGAQEWRFDVPFDLPTYAISPEMVKKFYDVVMKVR